ncbi:DinB family protein [Pedobacter sp. SYP-B3415]|uniref:DinB family protein n=1 Tax=Pedobacter sp. SYP-B3415 TaxID=2496641 RepID=UPI00101D82C2|nr:DinB family protein [Pedobacter sp. SYP-B3415]
MNELQKKLDNSFNQLITKLSDLSQDKLDRVPFSGSWTASQVGQHLLKSYQVVGVLQGPTERSTRPADQNVESLCSMFLDRSIKMTSPEVLLPDAHAIPREELVGALSGVTAQISHFAASEDLQPVCLGFELPGFGYLTRLEWIAFIQAHTERHLGQLNDIITSLNR